MIRMQYGWVLALPLVMLLPFLGQFAYPIHSSFSDLAISHYPNAVFLRRSILEYGQIPLWSGNILSGYPFAANPLSGLWYPPGWLALLFPLPFGLNLMAVLHIIFGGVGLVRLLRAEGLGLPAALIGGLAFEFLPRVIAHFAAGHLTLIYAIAWTPWLLWAARQAATSCSHKHLPWEAIFLALILLADVRWAAYAGLIWAGYRLTLRSSSSLRDLPHFAGSLLGQVLLAVALAAPLLIPLTEYTLLSTRRALSAADNLYLSLPPVRLLGLLAPAFDGNTEWTVYAGVVVLVQAVWAIGIPELRHKARFWTLLVGAGLLAALGSYLPGAEYLARLPGMNLLRVPARALLPAGLGLAALLAYSVQHLREPAGVGLKQAFWSRLAVAGLAGFSLLLAAGSWIITGSPQLGFTWGAGFALAAIALLFARDRQKISGRVWGMALSGLVVLDLAGVAAQMVVFRPAVAVRGEGEQAAAYLATKEGPFRIYSPSYSLPQQTSADYGLELADGVDPLQIAAYAAYMEKASGIPSEGYAVTVPPFEGDPSSGNAGYNPDADLLGRLNVSYVVSEFDLNSPELILVQQIGSTRIYQNERKMPRAWVESGETVRPVERLTLTPNQVEVHASGPGTLVLSEIVYPGWRVWVDGKPVNLEEPMDGLLRTVKIHAGAHRVRFRYEPTSVFLGLAVCGLCLLGLLLWRVKR